MQASTPRVKPRNTRPKVGSNSKSSAYFDRRMQFFAPRQRQSDGRWDYTRENNHGVFSIGYCAGWCEYTENDFVNLGNSFRELALQEQAELAKFKAKYHKDGHTCANDALRCYRIYVLDTQLKLDVKLFETQKKCAVCSAWTDGVAELGYAALYYLCDTHRVRKVVEDLYLAGVSPR